MCRGASPGPQHTCLLGTETRTGLGHSVTHTTLVFRPRVPSPTLPAMWFCLLVLCGVLPDTCTCTWFKTRWREVLSRGGTAMHARTRTHTFGSIWFVRQDPVRFSTVPRRRYVRQGRVASYVPWSCPTDAFWSSVTTPVKLGRLI
jgi:hypothetical protein